MRLELGGGGASRDAELIKNTWRYGKRGNVWRRRVVKDVSVIECMRGVNSIVEVHHISRCFG